jgi:hypothetical protein
LVDPVHTVDEADLAATWIWQGCVLVSPLATAMVAARRRHRDGALPGLIHGAGEDRPVLLWLPATAVAGLHKMIAQVGA